MRFFKKKEKIQYCGQTQKYILNLLENEIKHVLGICLRPQYTLFKVQQKLEKALLE